MSHEHIRSESVFRQSSPQPDRLNCSAMAKVMSGNLTLALALMVTSVRMCGLVMDCGDAPAVRGTAAAEQGFDAVLPHRDKGAGCERGDGFAGRLDGR